jgi:hypothetical protein
MRRQLAKQSFPEGIRPEVEALLNTVSGSDHADLEMLDYACHAVLRARLENARILAVRLLGQYDETTPRDPLFQGVTATLPPLPGENGPPALQSHTLAQVSNLFDEHNVKHNWVVKQRRM